MWLCRPAKIDRNNIDLGRPISVGGGPNGFPGEVYGNTPESSGDGGTPWLW